MQKDKLYFVLVARERATTSQDAQEMATRILESENFTGCRGYFGNCAGKADWFQVGGKWHNVLIEHTAKGREANRAVIDMVLTDFPQLLDGIRGVTYAIAEREQLRREAVVKANALFRTFFPTLDYSSNEHTGEADALLITEDIIEALSDDYFRNVEIFDPEFGERLCGDVVDLPDAYLGKYWIVTLHYCTGSMIEMVKRKEVSTAVESV